MSRTVIVHLQQLRSINHSSLLHTCTDTWKYVLPWFYVFLLDEKLPLHLTPDEQLFADLQVFIQSSKVLIFSFLSFISYTQYAYWIAYKASLFTRCRNLFIACFQTNQLSVFQVLRNLYEVATRLTLCEYICRKCASWLRQSQLSLKSWHKGVSWLRQLQLNP